MPRTKISLTRFNWKIPKWHDYKNVKAIWIYSLGGLPSFEFEIDPEMAVPKNLRQHARNSKNYEKPNFMFIKDPKVISKIGQIIKNLDIQGARGKSIYLGKIKLEQKDKSYEIPIYSTLEDWYDFKINNTEDMQMHTSHVKFT